MSDDIPDDPLEDGRSCVRPCVYCGDDLETEEPTQVIPRETMAEIQSGPTPAPRVVLRPGDPLFEGRRCLVAAEAIDRFLESKGLVICKRIAEPPHVVALGDTASALAIGHMALVATEALENEIRDEDESSD